MYHFSDLFTKVKLLFCGNAVNKRSDLDGTISMTKTIVIIRTKSVSSARDPTVSGEYITGAAGTRTRVQFGELPCVSVWIRQTDSLRISLSNL